MVINSVFYQYTSSGIIPPEHLTFVSLQTYYLLRVFIARVSNGILQVEGEEKRELRAR